MAAGVGALDRPGPWAHAVAVATMGPLPGLAGSSFGSPLAHAGRLNSRTVEFLPCGGLERKTTVRFPFNINAMFKMPSDGARQGDALYVASDRPELDDLRARPG